VSAASCNGLRIATSKTFEHFGIRTRHPIRNQQVIGQVVDMLDELGVHDGVLGFPRPDDRGRGSEVAPKHEQRRREPTGMKATAKGRRVTRCGQSAPRQPRPRWPVAGDTARCSGRIDIGEGSCATRPRRRRSRHGDGAYPITGAALAARFGQSGGSALHASSRAPADPRRRQRGRATTTRCSRPLFPQCRRAARESCCM
jgi:hypothetical protein